MRITLREVRQRAGKLAYALLLAGTCQTPWGHAQIAADSSASTKTSPLEYDPGLVLLQLGQAEGCATNLRRLVWSLEIYAADHGGRYIPCPVIR